MWLEVNTQGVIFQEKLQKNFGSSRIFKGYLFWKLLFRRLFTCYFPSPSFRFSGLYKSSLWACYWLLRGCKLHFLRAFTGQNVKDMIVNFLMTLYYNIINSTLKNIVTVNVLLRHKFIKPFRLQIKWRILKLYS